MVSVGSWPVVLSLGAAVGTVYLIVGLWRHRGAPGADWFLAVLGLQAAYTALYGVGFLVTDPALRAAVEVGFWVTFSWVGATFAAFAVTYTGRAGLLRTWPFLATVGVLAVVTLLVPFAPLSGLVWEGFAVVETAGVAGVSYERGPVLFLTFVINAVATAGSTVLLFDTVVSYGPLYRREATAVALSTVPPSVGATLWILGIGGVNLMPVLALPHVLLDAYAYLASDLFEFDPATRRASERAAVDELATPVIVLDRERRVVRLNETAVETLIDEREPTDGSDSPGGTDAALGEPLAALGLAFDPADPPETVELRVGGRRRTFGVTASPLSDTTDTQVGYTLVLQDITAERRRRQRLGVLNRVLRHNLRNDLSVVQLYADQLVETGRGETPELAETIRAQAAGLLELGDKAREAADALDTEGSRRTIPVAAILEEAVGGAGEPSNETDDGHGEDGAGPQSVTLSVPKELAAHVDPAPLTLAVANLVENAREHGAPPTQVTAWGDGDEVVIEVRDEGPGVPEHELDMLRAETETALEHGSGLGLWLVRWGVDAVGGELTVDTTDGTTATLRVPGRVAEGTDTAGAADTSRVTETNTVGETPPAESVESQSVSIDTEN